MRAFIHGIHPGSFFRARFLSCGVVPATAHKVPASVQKLLDQRAAARAAQDWAKSDVLRAKLGEAGFEVIDDTATKEQVLVLNKENKAKVQAQQDRKAKAVRKSPPHLPLPILEDWRKEASSNDLSK